MPSVTIPTVIAGVGAAGSIASGIMGSNAAGDAAQVQANAANNASAEQLQAAQLAANTQLDIYGQTKSTLAPFVGAGTGALSQLSSLLGLNGGGSAGAMSTLQNLPGYQFSLQQGGQALDRSAASRGLLLSGAQLKDSQQFGQGLAQSQYFNYLSPLQGLINTGENAGAMTGNAGSAAGSGAASAYLGGANSAAASQLAGAQSTASGIVGSNNALSTGLSSGLQNALLGYQLQQPNMGNFNLGSLDPSTMSFLGGSIPSDVRLKTDIKRVGSTLEGLPVYTYRYKAGGPMQMGVMAQDVEKTRPSAVKTHSSGFKMVDYSQISPLARAA